MNANCFRCSGTKRRFKTISIPNVARSISQDSSSGSTKATQCSADTVKISASRNSHIPADLVVDRWVSDGEGSSLLDFPFPHNVWSYHPSQNNPSNINGLRVCH